MLEITHNNNNKKLYCYLTPNDNCNQIDSKNAYSESQNLLRQLKFVCYMHAYVYIVLP